MLSDAQSEVAGKEKRASRVSRFFAGDQKIGSNRMPRLINRNLVFNQIRIRQPISRADLARTSGLQRSTISLIVEELIMEGWIVEGRAEATPRGRHPIVLNLNGWRSTLALDIHPAQTTLALTDLGGNILDESVLDLPAEPQSVVDAIISAMTRMIKKHNDRTFDGIGINLPGRFDSKGEKITFAPNVHWPIGHIKSRVEKATGLRVVVDNVANACALSEVWFGYSDGTHDLVVVNVSEGVGTGIFANGRLLRGENGVAGEFGHVQLDPAGLPCGCGSTGCWETVASNRAGLRYYSENTGTELSSFGELLMKASREEPAARDAVEKMCRALGRGMRVIATALAPREIVVVGDITSLWAWTGKVIEKEMCRDPLVRIPELRPAYEGSRARLRSAVALIMNEHLL